MSNLNNAVVEREEIQMRQPRRHGAVDDNDHGSPIPRDASMAVGSLTSLRQ
jgi:hypothetical protein